MLHLLRRAAKTWAFRVIFALLIVSFAVWGIGDLSLGGAGTRVAQVGERRVTVEDYAIGLSRELNGLARRAGRPIDVEEARELGVPQALLARFVRDAALDDEARRLGISADDDALHAAIVASPSFQGLNGAFDQEQYRFVLDRLGFRVDRFEADLRRSLAREAVARGVSEGVRGAPGFAEALTAREFELRLIEAVSLPLTDAAEPEAPGEEALRAFHAEYPGLYEAPATRTVSWIEIDPAALVSEVEVPEEDLRAAYAAAADRYDQPERRVLDRIVFSDEAEAQAARDAIEAGETSFEAVAEARGLSAADIALGETARDELGAAAEAVFAAELGVAGPAPTALGPALFNIRAILPARTTSFEQARDELRAQLGLRAAGEAAVVRAEQVADLLASGAALEAIASETGLPLKRAEALTRAGDGASGLAAAPAFLEEAFAAAPGEERDVIETGAGGYALLRVDAANPAAVQPFEAVRAEVADDWVEDQRRKALEARAAQAMERLAGGAPMTEVAAELGAELQVLPAMRRAEAAEALPEDAMATLYGADAPGAAAVAATEDGLTLLRLAAIEPADLEAGPAAEAARQIREALDAAVQSDLYAYYAAAVQSRAEVAVNNEAVEQAINSLR